MRFPETSFFLVVNVRHCHWKDTRLYLSKLITCNDVWTASSGNHAELKISKAHHLAGALHNVEMFIT